MHNLGQELLNSLLSAESSLIREACIKIPLLSNAGTLGQGPGHTRSLLEHLIETAKRCTLSLPDDPILSLGGLFHDIGKVSTVRYDSNSKPSFHKHEIVGSTSTWNILKQLGFANNICKDVSFLVRHHMFRFEEIPTPKSIRKWLFLVGKNHKRLLELRIQDRLSNETKRNLPAKTSQHLALEKGIQELINSQKPIFKEDINLSIDDQQTYNIDWNDIAGLVFKDPAKNNSDFLKSFCERTYGRK